MQNQYPIATIFGIVIIFLILVLFVRHYKQAQKLNSDLREGEPTEKDVLGMEVSASTLVSEYEPLEKKLNFRDIFFALIVIVSLFIIYLNRPDYKVFSTTNNVTEISAPNVSE